MSKTCRDFVESTCTEKANEGKKLEFGSPYPPGGCAKGGRFRNVSRRGNLMYAIIGGTSIAASMFAAFLAIRERNLYEMKKGDMKKSAANELRRPVLNVESLGTNFFSGNRMHFVHSVAIVAAPYASTNAIVTTALFLSGIGLYSGAQYYRSFAREPDSLVPVLWTGGLLLLGGWLSFLM